MNDAPTDPMLEMLRKRERLLEKEYEQARIDAGKMVAVADARLTEVRGLIEALADAKRWRSKGAGHADR